MADNGHRNGKIGKTGEDIACRYLIDNGFAILERNWRHRHLEVDIIAMDRHGIHFVEVKSGTEPRMSRPEESVTPAKQKRIAAAASSWAGKNGNGEEFHFDIVTVIFGKEDYEINFIPDAFIPTYF